MPNKRVSNDYIETMCDWSCKAEIAQLKARNAVYERIMGPEAQAFADEFGRNSAQLAAAEAKIERVNNLEPYIAWNEFADERVKVVKVSALINALSDTEAQ